MGYTVRTSFSRSQFNATIDFIVRNNVNSFSRIEVESRLNAIIADMHRQLVDGREVYSSGTMGFHVLVIDSYKTDTELQYFLEILVSPDLADSDDCLDTVELIRWP